MSSVVVQCRTPWRYGVSQSACLSSLPSRAKQSFTGPSAALKATTSFQHPFIGAASKGVPTHRHYKAEAASGGVHESSSPVSTQDGYTLYSEKAIAKEARMDSIEGWIEKTIFNCRFLTLMAVTGSLVGSAICFIKGSLLVVDSVKVFAHNCLKGVNTGKVILLLVEALDVYLIATVMLIFGLGLYELFVDTLDPPKNYDTSSLLRSRSSSLFGLFPLRTRPKWLEIHSLDEMKTKLGHVIVMILLVGMFEKSKKVTVTTANDLFLFSASVALSAACLYLLSKLHGGGAAEGLGPSNGHNGGNGHGYPNGAPRSNVE